MHQGENVMKSEISLMYDVTNAFETPEKDTCIYHTQLKFHSHSLQTFGVNDRGYVFGGYERQGDLAVTNKKEILLALRGIIDSG